MTAIHTHDFTLKIREKDEVRCLFDNLNMSIPKGSILMLVGASGSGKSTFLRLLTGLLTPLAANIEMSGSFKLFGCELLQISYPKILHREVGLVFQDFALFDDFTPRDNILFSGEISGRYHSSLDLENNIDQLAYQLGIEEALKSSHVSDLSGGQKQRVAMCRLLIAAPKMMIFDEPTSGLDPLSAKKAAQLIMEQSRDDNIVVIVTHDYRPFLENSQHRIDYIGIMDGSGAFYLQQPGGRCLADIEQEVEKHVQKASSTIHSVKIPSDKRSSMIVMDFFCKVFLMGQKILSLKNAVLPKLHNRWHQNVMSNIFRFSVINAIPFVIISGIILGLLSTYFSLSENLGELQRYLDPLLFSQALSAIGKIGFVAICPLFTAVFIATRSGAAVSGYLGNLTLTKQIDAYRVYGVEPENLFLDKIIWSFGIGFFILSFFCFLGFMSASFCIVLLLKSDFSYQEWYIAFHKSLGAPPFYKGWGWFVAKSVTAGVITGFSSYMLGTWDKKNSQHLTQGITRCIIVNIILVLLIFFIFLMWERSL